MFVFCRGCGKEIHETATTCPSCGAPQEGYMRNNERDVMPDGIKGWSWGAFLLNWIWAIGNNTLIGLFALIPFLGFFMAIVLGFKGREWAWRNRKWESIEHFNRVQERWSFWGVMLIVGPVFLGVILAIAIPAYSDYQHRARMEAGKKQVSVEHQADDPNSSIPSQPSVAAEKAKQMTPEQAVIARAEYDQSQSQQRSDRIRKLYEARNYKGVIVEARAGQYMLTEHNLVGLAFYATNQFSDAIVLFRESENNFPNNPVVKSNLGDAFFSNGQLIEAIEKYREALALSPNNESYKQRIQQVQQAVNHLRQTMQKENTVAVVDAPSNKIRQGNTVQASIEPARNDARDYAVETPQPPPLEAAKPNRITPKTKYPTFIMAIANKDAVDVELYLQSGFDPNNKISGTLPIAAAAEAGSLEVIKVLIKYGANPSYSDDHGRSALFYASINGKKEIAQYLKSIGVKQ